MEISVLLKALGDPTRLCIFENILKRKHCVRSLSKKLGISESAVSQHMKILREAGLVYGQKFGYHTHYLPEQKALDYLSAAFDDMKKQSENLSRDGECVCEFRRERGNA